MKKKEKTRVERRAHGAVWQHCETRGCTCSFITDAVHSFTSPVISPVEVSVFPVIGHTPGSHSLHQQLTTIRCPSQPFKRHTPDGRVIPVTIVKHSILKVKVHAID